MATQTIVIGGGLSGLSAAHTILENGGRVLVLDKMPFFGGNSTKATSGINGAGTATQRQLGIQDSPELFEEDTRKSAREGYNKDLVHVLTFQSGPAVEWLQHSFDLDLSLVALMGGHSARRTHRGKERFPGMTITYALMEKLEKICEETPDKARVMTKTKAIKLLTENGTVVGVEYDQGGKVGREYGSVVIATGGFGADFTPGSLLEKYCDEWRGLTAWKSVKHLPDLLSLPTTNGEHCTGDGIKMAMDIGARLKDMEAIQVHPTGLVHPDEPDAKLKFLAAEALRGVGGILLNGDGKRFCDDIGKRDYVTSMMWNNKPPFRLVLNSKASNEMEWHCKHYKGRGLMKGLTGEELAREIGISSGELKQEFDLYNSYAQNKNDPWGKRFFNNVPYSVDDHFHVAIVTPVVHYTMGGLAISPDSEVLGDNGPIPGLFCAGEAMGGVHGKNRLGGNSLLDCVAFGRVAGRSASKYLLSNALSELRQGRAKGRLANVAGHLAPISINVDPQQGHMSINIDLNASGSGSGVSQQEAQPEEQQQQEEGAAEAKPEAAPAAAPATKTYTLEEVSKHNTDKDCWVVVNGDVLDVTEFLNDHPGGAKAILLYAGKDASEEFNMLHKPDVVSKYAPDSIIGKLA